MEDFIYFQINQGSKPFRYFGLKKDKGMPISDVMEYLLKLDVLRGLMQETESKFT